MIMLVTGVVSLLVSKRLLTVKTMENIDETVTMTLHGLDLSVSPLVANGDMESLQKFVERAGANSMTDSLQVCSISNVVIASKNPDDIGKECGEYIRRELLSGRENIYKSDYNETGVYEAAVPVSGPGYSAVDGAVYLKVSDAYIADIYDNFQTYVIGQYIALIVVLSGLLVIVINHTILGPLKMFETTVTKIAEGDYDVHVSYSSNGEIGEFADTLNKMSHEIRLKKSQLETSNKHFAEYLRAMDESTIIIRSSIYGKITYANRKFYEISGLSEKETIGCSIMALRGDSFGGEDVLEYWDTILKNFLWKGVITNYNSEGRPYYVNATVCPIISTDGEVLEIIDIWHDVTQIYELKEELRHHKENLEETVIKRTDDLRMSEQKYRDLYEESKRLNEELIKAQGTIMQQEKLASIGQLAAGIAHELNNPIGFVSGNFDVLKNYYSMVKNYIDQIEKSGEAYPQVMEEIKEARNRFKMDYITDDTVAIFDESLEGFRRISAIINSLRDFSRIDHENKVTPYNINEGVRNTLTISKNETKYVAEVETELNDVPDIICNGGEINQVLLNIIINAAQAVKASETIPGKIKVKTYESGGEVHCLISDTGTGIPQEIIDKVFDPFFTTRAPGSGKGLGLSVSYDIIVNKHKGRLSVESAPTGSTFHIVLPAGAGVIKSEADDESIQ